MLGWVPGLLLGPDLIDLLSVQGLLLQQSTATDEALQVLLEIGFRMFCNKKAL